MAKTIQIRNVPDNVHRTLRVRAAEAGLSLSDYLLRDLERIAQRPPVADVLLRAGDRAEGTSVARIVAAVRSSRERRGA
jgi:plasmid stability protein